jgi:hypothetical protein
MIQRRDDMTKQITAYHRDSAGLIEMIQILRDGECTPLDAAGYELTRTGEIVTLQGWPHGECELCHNNGGLEILVPTMYIEEPEGAGEYLVITDDESWGSDVLTDEAHEAACTRAEMWLNEHQGPHYSIAVRPVRDGEIAATYWIHGGREQILGGSIPVPDAVHELIQDAWNHACETWPTE